MDPALPFEPGRIDEGAKLYGQPLVSAPAHRLDHWKEIVPPPIGEPLRGGCPDARHDHAVVQAYVNTGYGQRQQE